jgi:hypothetical protein
MVFLFILEYRYDVLSEGCNIGFMTKSSALRKPL